MAMSTSYINVTVNTLCRILEPLGNPCAVYAIEELSLARKSVYFNLLGTWVLLILWLVAFIVTKQYDYFVLVYCMKKEGLDIHLIDLVWPEPSARIRYIVGVPVRMRPAWSVPIPEIKMPVFRPEPAEWPIREVLAHFRKYEMAKLEAVRAPRSIMAEIVEPAVMIQQPAVAVAEEPELREDTEEPTSVWRGLLLELSYGESVGIPASWVDYLSCR